MNEEKEDKNGELPSHPVEEEEDVTDRLTALEQGQEKIMDILSSMQVAHKAPETPPVPEPKDRTPESPNVNLESPFKTIYVRKRGGRIVKRQVPKDAKTKKNA